MSLQSDTLSSSGRSSVDEAAASHHSNADSAGRRTASERSAPLNDGSETPPSQKWRHARDAPANVVGEADELSETSLSMTESSTRHTAPPTPESVREAGRGPADRDGAADHGASEGSASLDDGSETPPSQKWRRARDAPANHVGEADELTAASSGGGDAASSSMTEGSTRHTAPPTPESMQESGRDGAAASTTASSASFDAESEMSPSETWRRVRNVVPANVIGEASEISEASSCSDVSVPTDDGSASNFSDDERRGKTLMGTIPAPHRNESRDVAAGRGGASPPTTLSIGSSSASLDDGNAAWRRARNVVPATVVQEADEFSSGDDDATASTGTGASTMTGSSILGSEVEVQPFSPTNRRRVPLVAQPRWARDLPPDETASCDSDVSDAWDRPPAETKSSHADLHYKTHMAKIPNPRDYEKPTVGHRRERMDSTTVSVVRPLHSTCDLLKRDRKVTLATVPTYERKWLASSTDGETSDEDGGGGFVIRDRKALRNRAQTANHYSKSASIIDFGDGLNGIERPLSPVATTASTDITETPKSSVSSEEAPPSIVSRPPTPVVTDEDRGLVLDRWICKKGARSGAATITVTNVLSLDAVHDTVLEIYYKDTRRARSPIIQLGAGFDFSFYLSVEDDTVPVVFVVSEVSAFLRRKKDVGFSAVLMRSSKYVTMERGVNALGSYYERCSLKVPLMQMDASSVRMGEMMLRWQFDLREESGTDFCPNCGKLNFKCDCTSGKKAKRELDEKREEEKIAMQVKAATANREEAARQRWAAIETAHAAKTAMVAAQPAMSIRGMSRSAMPTMLEAPKPLTKEMEEENMAVPNGETDLLKTDMKVNAVTSAPLENKTFHKSCCVVM
jgi:hypothetical protein